MNIEYITDFLCCFVPIGMWIGVILWLAWDDKDKFD